MKTIIFTIVLLFTNINIFAKEIYGIDLSHHNKVSNWNKIEASFVYLKSTEGASFKDPTFKYRVKQCKKRKILVGAYHYMTTSSSAEEQFSNFKKVVKKSDIDLIPVIDIEINKNHISVAKLRKLVTTFSKLCEKEYGVTPIIYSSQRFFMVYFIGLSNDFWCGDINSRVYLPHVIHQKTIKHVPGIVGKVDYNILNCKIKEIKISKK